VGSEKLLEEQVTEIARHQGAQLTLNVYSLRISLLHKAFWVVHSHEQYYWTGASGELHMTRKCRTETISPINCH
jgi:hypothetical protein